MLRSIIWLRGLTALVAVSLLTVSVVEAQQKKQQPRDRFPPRHPLACTPDRLLLICRKPFEFREIRHPANQKYLHHQNA